MADRYWVGGSGNWTSTSDWSTSSGGSGGASVPTAADNAIFDVNSGVSTYTVVVADNATCADLTITPLAIDGYMLFSIGNGFVVAGTLSTSDTAGNRRIWFRSTTFGLMRDLEIGTIGTVADLDFRDVRITGTGGTLSGTRIGDLQGNSNITFDAPKSCFRIDAGSWSDDQWAGTSGGTPNTAFFPLAQDTAVFDESTTGGTHLMNSAVPYAGALDMSLRTSPLTLTLAAAYFIHGDWTFGSGVTALGSNSVFILNRQQTQRITSAGVVCSYAFIIDTFSGTTELADALTTTNALSHFSGTFDTKNYNLTLSGAINSSNFNVRTLKLGSSAVSIFSSLILTTTTNLTFDAGTSLITLNPGAVFNGGGLAFYDVSIAAGGGFATTQINGANTFNNLTVNGPTAGEGVYVALFSDNQTITGTLTMSAASDASLRTVARSSTAGVTRTLTVGTLLADYCDFRDIAIVANTTPAPTNAGDCGGNSGITFPAPKTVYWNLAGNVNWTSTGWAATSGGTPDAANFPLAQDTAVFDEAGSAGTISINSYNLGTIDTSARTTAMALTTSGSFFMFGDLTLSSAVTITSSPRSITFAGSGTQTITSSGVAIDLVLIVDSGSGTVRLADALESSLSRTLTLTSGKFDAASYNVTVGSVSTLTRSTVEMGSGTWTLGGAGTVWNYSGGVLVPGTADIVLSSTNTSSRTFFGGNLSYNKLTIGGATGTSTLTISGNNQFSELASTKTVAHTISLSSTTQTFGKWTVTGTAGNVVTLTGTGINQILAGPATSGIDYINMGSIRFDTGNQLSYGEFYAGANSTASATPSPPVYLTDNPGDSIRYWVGGSGNWNDTNKWSTTSGGSGGAVLPRSHDDVVFNAASSVSSYIVQINSIPGGNRCKALTVGPASAGGITLANNAPLVIHGDFLLPSADFTRTYSGSLYFIGTAAGNAINTNGQVLNSGVVLAGIDSEWSLSAALNIGTQGLTVLNGSLSTAGFTVTCGSFSASTRNKRTVNLGSSSIRVGGNFLFGTTEDFARALTFDAGTSTITMTGVTSVFQGNGQTFYNVRFDNAGGNVFSLSGGNTFNSLEIPGRESAGVAQYNVFADQTVTGALTFLAGTTSGMRTFIKSDSIGQPRTITCGTISSLTDVDFRDITLAVSTAPVSGTRLGNCLGNTGITFNAGKTVYKVGGTTLGTSNGFALSSGGTASDDHFPLAQDTAVWDNNFPNNSDNLFATFNLGTIDMSARTSALTFSCGAVSPIHGNWINGSGTTIAQSGSLVFVGRGSQTLTSAGKTFTPSLVIDSPGGTVTLQDAFETDRSSSAAFDLLAGTFDANGYSLTISSSLGGVSLDGGGAFPKVLGIGSGTWVIAGSGTFVWDASPAPNLTITGTGTISMTGGTAKSFFGGNLDYSGITLDQGGAGQLNVFQSNTFGSITNTYGAIGPTSISFGTNSNRVGNFTASGTAGNLLTISGQSTIQPCTLVYTGVGNVSIEYVILNGVKAYTQ